MRTTAIDAILTTLFMAIPQPILEMAYDSRENDTSLDNRITEKLIKPIVHKQVNILCGKTKTVTLTSQHLNRTPMTTFGNQVGMGIESQFYTVDAQQRENRDIAWVIGPCETLSQPYSGGGYMGAGGSMLGGNTMMGNASFMLNSRTLSRAAVPPVFDVAGSNTIRVTPGLMACPFLVDVLLGYDYEFSNAEPSVIIALQDYATLCAKRDIHTRLTVAIDQGEIFAGSELGAIKDIISGYDIQDDQLKTALLAVQTASQFDLARMNRILYHKI